MKSIGARLLASPAGRGPVERIGICVPGFVQPRNGHVARRGEHPRLAGRAHPRDLRVRVREAGDGGRRLPRPRGRRAVARARPGDPGFPRAGPGLWNRDGHRYRGRALPWERVEVRGDRALSWWTGRRALRVRKQGVPGDRRLGKGNCPRRRCRASSRGRSPLLKDLTHGNAAEVTAQDVAVAASMGDGFAASLLHAAGSRNRHRPGTGGERPQSRPRRPRRRARRPRRVPSRTPSPRRSGSTQCRESGRTRGIAVSELGVDGSARGSAQMAADLVVSGA